MKCYSFSSNNCSQFLLHRSSASLKLRKQGPAKGHNAIYISSSYSFQIILLGKERHKTCTILHKLLLKLVGVYLMFEVSEAVDFFNKIKLLAFTKGILPPFQLLSSQV